MPFLVCGGSPPLPVMPSVPEFKACLVQFLQSGLHSSLLQRWGRSPRAGEQIWVYHLPLSSNSPVFTPVQHPWLQILLKTACLNLYGTQGQKLFHFLLPSPCRHLNDFGAFSGEKTQVFSLVQSVIFNQNPSFFFLCTSLFKISSLGH